MGELERVRSMRSLKLCPGKRRRVSLDRFPVGRLRKLLEISGLGAVVIPSLCEVIQLMLEGPV